MEHIKETIHDIVTERSESFIDTLTDNELVKQIPCIKTLIALREDTLSYLEKRKRKQIIEFLKNCNELSAKDITSFMNKHIKSTEKTGERILDSVLSMNLIDKAALAGRLYSKVVSRDTNYEDYFRLAQIIQNCFYEDLYALTFFKDNVEFTNDGNHCSPLSISNLFHLGLLKLSNDFDGGTALALEKSYESYFITDYGKLIRDCL